jgi:hypothetical protein
VGVPEARIEQSDEGAVVASEGWFVLNAADASWTGHERSGRWVNFEGREHPFREFGIGIHVLQPGEPNGKYHAEEVQEDFLVLSGECICLIEGRREGRAIHYPADALAARYGAAAPFETDKPPEAYSDWPPQFQPLRGDWPPRT